MAKKVHLGPVTRVEGHLSVNLEVEKRGQRYVVVSAYTQGEMFRGFENFLQKRDPLDAQQIIQRMCGFCPISQGIASCKAQEQAYNITPNKNGQLLQNLILGANFLQSHILHFYLLSLLDFVDVVAILGYQGKDGRLIKLKEWTQHNIKKQRQGDFFALGPFFPRYEGDFYIKEQDINVEFIDHYLMAMDMRRIAHEMCAIYGAKAPHATAIVPGGVTQRPTMENILAYRSRLKKLKDFVERYYIPDVFHIFSLFSEYWKVGKGYKNLLSYGVFDLEDNSRLFKPGAIVYGKYEPLDIEKILEHVKYSRFSSLPLHPKDGKTNPAPDKQNAYTWIKAPRYDNHPMEVGPLARILVEYYSPNKSKIKEFLDSVMKKYNLNVTDFFSTAGRHVARALELSIITDNMFKWLDELDIEGDPTRDFDLVKNGEGVGLVEAPRGALGHWLKISNYRIERYQCVVPTTWNFSPRDNKDNLGPVEFALKGVMLKDIKEPMEAARVVRSFDPCLACAVH